jgi:alanyl aminopeptidase
MREQLADADQRTALDSLARHAYGARLTALTLDEQPGEPDEAKLERQALVNLLARAGDTDLRMKLAQRARAALASGLGGTKLAANQRASALEVLAQDGSDAEFAALEQALRAAEDAQLRRDLVRALGAALSPERGRHARALALDPAVRSGELSTLLASHFAWRENRAIGRAWFRGNQGAIFEKLPTLSSSSSPSTYATGACSEGDARDVETRFAEPLATLEGGPRALAQLAEGIRLCAALRAHHSQTGFGAAVQ